MIKLTKHEKQILIEIFKSVNGLFIFTIHRQLTLSPKDLFYSIGNLKSLGLICVEEDRVTITREGIGYASKTHLKTKIDSTRHNLVKEEFLGKRININEFYIPQNFEK